MDSRLKALAVIGLVSLLLAACRGGPVATQPGATQPGATASTGAVTIQGFAFEPATLTVKVGTSVIWTNKDGRTHTITSDDGVWDSGRVSDGATYVRVFDQAGSFSYHCSIH